MNVVYFEISLLIACPIHYVCPYIMCVNVCYLTVWLYPHFWQWGDLTYELHQERVRWERCYLQYVFFVIFVREMANWCIHHTETKASFSLRFQNSLISFVNRRKKWLRQKCYIKSKEQICRQSVYHSVPGFCYHLRQTCKPSATIHFLV